MVHRWEPNGIPIVLAVRRCRSRGEKGGAVGTEKEKREVLRVDGRTEFRAEKTRAA